MVYDSLKGVARNYWCIIKLQLGLGLVILLITCCFSRSLNTLLSAAIGVILVVVSTLAYIKCAWSRVVLNSNQVLARHKKAEMAKFVVNLLGFVIVFSCYRQVQAVVLFAAYVVMLSSYWFGLLCQRINL